MNEYIRKNGNHLIDLTTWSAVLLMSVTFLLARVHLMPKHSLVIVAAICLEFLAPVVILLLVLRMLQVLSQWLGKANGTTDFASVAQRAAQFMSACFLVYLMFSLPAVLQGMFAALSLTVVVLRARALLTAS